VAVIAGLAILALLVVGFATGHIFFFVASDQPAQPRPADAFPQVGNAQDGVVRGGQVSFTYPKRWQVRHEPDMAASGTPTGVTILGLGTGNEVVIETMPLNLLVENPADFGEFSNEIGRLMQQHEGSTHDRVTGGPTAATLSGFPAVEYDLQGRVPVTRSSASGSS
jgi:hypothetical protein